MPLQGVNVVEVGSHHVRAPSVFKDINGVNASSITGVWTPTSGTTWTLLGGTIAAGDYVAVTMSSNGGSSSLNNAGEQFQQLNLTEILTY